MYPILVFCLTALGLFLIATALWPGTYPPAARAIRAMAPHKLTQTQLILTAIAEKIRPFISLDPIQRLRLAEALKSLGHTESPEEFEANAWSKGIFFAAALLWLPLLSIPLGLAAMVLVCMAVRRSCRQSLERDMAARRQAIERELPQLAGTICQSLQTTRDVAAILASYRKVCGPALAGEIDRTMNDMLTGNPERALRSLEGRVASPQFGQLTRGLISVLRGDDQRVYFQMLAAEYRKAQNEEIAQELLKRPEKLHPNMGLLFLCLVLMIAASLGKDLIDQMGVLFS